MENRLEKLVKKNKKLHLCITENTELARRSLESRTWTKFSLRTPAGIGHTCWSLPATCSSPTSFRNRCVPDLAKLQTGLVIPNVKTPYCCENRSHKLTSL